jgi:hypothetical protein
MDIYGYFMDTYSYIQLYTVIYSYIQLYIPHSFPYPIPIQTTSKGGPGLFAAMSQVLVEPPSTTSGRKLEAARLGQESLKSHG